MKNLHAFTETSPSNGEVPAYLSLNKHDDGTLWLSVRARGANTQSCIQLSPEQLEQFATDVVEAING